MNAYISDIGDIILSINGHSIILDHKKCDDLIRIIKGAKSDSELIIKLNKRKCRILNSYKNTQNTPDMKG